ncbi:uncharacterized protein G2W53_040614 [Senna tora]|uniref:Uncharacterized protein n=1 Tax=Senna tora TaxID=362788 RepID=A0A834SDH2_9FABA|nr:uncharacterized protein G2W53_040614 [Senna tora]
MPPRSSLIWITTHIVAVAAIAAPVIAVQFSPPHKIPWCSQQLHHRRRFLKPPLKPLHEVSRRIVNKLNGFDVISSSFCWVQL